MKCLRMPSKQVFKIYNLKGQSCGMSSSGVQSVLVAVCFCRGADLESLFLYVSLMIVVRDASFGGVVEEEF